MKDQCVTGPIYTTIESVAVRLANKVQFQKDKSQAVDGELPDALLNQLVCDAETNVEQDLRGRYAIPFRSKVSGNFAGLPDHSQRAIRRACDLAAVLEVLRTDFGRGTSVDAEDYMKSDQEAYDRCIKRLLGQDAEGKEEKHARFRFSPPLEGMALAASNREADDGYKGMIINTDDSTHGAESYAVRHVNNPAESYIDPLFRRGRR